MQMNKRVKCINYGLGPIFAPERKLEITQERMIMGRLMYKFNGIRDWWNSKNFEEVKDEESN